MKIQSLGFPLRSWRIVPLFCLAVVLSGPSGYAEEPTITVTADKPAGKVSPLFYGLMTEEINHSYDGGLYAELVQNRAFSTIPKYLCIGAR